VFVDAGSKAFLSAISVRNLCLYDVVHHHHHYHYQRLACSAQIYSNKKAVLSQGNRAMPQLYVVFGLKFADNINYKFKSSQASKAS